MPLRLGVDIDGVLARQRDLGVPKALAAIGVGFGTPGTGLGTAGATERDAAISDLDDPGVQTRATRRVAH